MVQTAVARVSVPGDYERAELLSQPKGAGALWRTVDHGSVSGGITAAVQLSEEALSGDKKRM